MQHVTNINIQLFEGYCNEKEIDGKEIIAYISSKMVKLIIAASDHTKANGMMKFSEPDYSHGMLFIYDKPIVLDFWMKNVNYPLDILFFGSDFKLVDYFTMDSYNGEADSNLKIYRCKYPAQYAVELKAGWADKNLKESDLTLRF